MRGKKGRLGSMIAGFVVLLVGLQILPQVMKQIEIAQVNYTSSSTVSNLSSGLSGAFGASQTIMNLIPLFFMLAIGLIGLIIASSFLRGSGLMSEDYDGEENDYDGKEEYPEEEHNYHCDDCGEVYEKSGGEDLCPDCLDDDERVMITNGEQRESMSDDSQQEETFSRGSSESREEAIVTSSDNPIGKPADNIQPGWWARFFQSFRRNKI